MPVLGVGNNHKYQTAKDATLIWDSFRGGLNTLFAPTEIAENELSQMDNLYLMGKGIPTPRPGMSNYFLTAASVATNVQQVRGLKMVKFASGPSGVLELLALGDSGYLVKQNNASYSIIPGYSYSSGYDAQLIQLFNQVYIANGLNVLTRYNGVTITSFVSITSPTSVIATLVSGASGTFTYAWQVSATNVVGETDPSAEVLLSGLPLNLVSASVQISWAGVSPASNVLRYSIYGREVGQETFMDSTDERTTTWYDNGLVTPSLIILPSLTNTTGGPIYKYHVSSKDKIFGANLDFARSRVVWSGGGRVNVNKFDWTVGGGYIDVSPDDGDEITGLVDSFNSIIVFKERSVWRLTLSIGNLGIVIPNLTLLNRNIGAIAPKSIVQVENDVIFLSRKGVFGLGYQPNIFTGQSDSGLRTNELSAKIRPVFQGLNPAQLSKCVAVYYDLKYRIAYPGVGATKNDHEVWYDRERLCWVGPMNYQYASAPNVYETFIAADQTQHLLFGDTNDNFVTELTPGATGDKGVIVNTTLSTKKELFDDPYIFKRIIDVLMDFRNVAGTLNVNILVEKTTGSVVVAKNFSITASTTGVGWGFDKWGTVKWGTTLGAGNQASSNDLVKWVKLLQTARSIRFEITTTTANGTYQLLSIKTRFRKLPQAIKGQGWRIP